MLIVSAIDVIKGYDLNLPFNPVSVLKTVQPSLVAVGYRALRSSAVVGPTSCRSPAARANHDTSSYIICFGGCTAAG
jgi:hypothetical protein